MWACMGLLLDLLARIKGSVFGYKDSEHGILWFGKVKLVKKNSFNLEYVLSFSLPNTNLKGEDPGNVDRFNQSWSLDQGELNLGQTRDNLPLTISSKCMLKHGFTSALEKCVDDSSVVGKSCIESFEDLHWSRWMKNSVFHTRWTSQEGPVGYSDALMEVTLAGELYCWVLFRHETWRNIGREMGPNDLCKIADNVGSVASAFSCVGTGFISWFILKPPWNILSKEWGHTDLRPEQSHQEQHYKRYFTGNQHSPSPVVFRLRLSWAQRWNISALFLVLCPCITLVVLSEQRPTPCWAQELGLRLGTGFLLETNKPGILQPPPFCLS